jgi:hypothetical protein
MVFFDRRNQLLTLVRNKTGGLKSCSVKAHEKRPDRLPGQGEESPERRDAR